jgi:FkbM family methyltransferase
MTTFNTSWIGKFVERPSVIFDVGAFDCTDALRFKQAFPRSQVVAFEACPDNYVTIDLPKMAQLGVEVHHLAVCEQDGETDFYSNTDSGQPGMSGSILIPTEKLKTEHTHLRFLSGRKVKSTRLDTFCHQHEIHCPDVLHIDVQGAELKVLQGLGDLRPKMIYLEINETREFNHYAGAGSVDDLRLLLKDRRYNWCWGSSQDELYVLDEICQKLGSTTQARLACS